MTNRLVEGNTIIGKLPDDTYGIMIYKTNEQYRGLILRTKQGKLRTLKGKRLDRALQAYGDFVLEKHNNLEEADNVS